MTAKEWRESNPELDGNIRDYTDILHLVVLSNLEVLEGRMSKYCMIEIAFNNKEEINETRMIKNGSDK